MNTAFPRPRLVVAGWLPGAEPSSAPVVDALLGSLAAGWETMGSATSMNASDDELRTAWRDVDGFVLSNPPFSTGITPARVFTGRLIRLFPHTAMEDGSRLTSEPMRDRFLTLLFSLARFRQVADSGSVAQLTRFHAAHKYLLLAYSEAGMRELGGLAATASERSWAEVVQAYRAVFVRSLARPARPASHANALAHAFGHVSDHLEPSQRQDFVRLVGRFVAGEHVLQDALGLLRGWADQHGIEYLQAQTYLAPYPDLLRLSAS
ncbi:MAG TPA: YbgA family protein [Longimicrobiales bacterium]|nr:YbgA family protein [Longimicrobiales bacterium]